MGKNRIKNESRLMEYYASPVLPEPVPVLNPLREDGTSGMQDGTAAIDIAVLFGTIEQKAAERITAGLLSTCTPDDLKQGSTPRFVMRSLLKCIPERNALSIKQAKPNVLLRAVAVISKSICLESAKVLGKEWPDGAGEYAEFLIQELCDPVKEVLISMAREVREGGGVFVIVGIVDPSGELLGSRACQICPGNYTGLPTPVSLN